MELRPLPERLDVATIVARASTVLEGLPRPPRLVVLFGSYARGTAGAGSDVDIAIAPDGDMSLSDELSLEEKLTSVLGIEVDLARLDVDDVTFRYRVARDGVVVFSRPAWEAPRFFARAAIEHDEMAPLIADACERFARKHAGGAA